MVTIPSFEVDGQPSPTLGLPKGPSAVKVQTARAEQGRSPSELLVVLLDDLEHRAKSASVTHDDRGRGEEGVFFSSFP